VVEENLLEAVLVEEENLLEAVHVVEENLLEEAVLVEEENLLEEDFFETFIYIKQKIIYKRKIMLNQTCRA
jgi:hypothetical protein